uniref:Uncharacterized protein n=1 Tax=Bosea sp. NBC_00436 TaxID=2969620 RepID=A0A9E7ZNV8_9HYPH
MSAREAAGDEGTCDRIDVGSDLYWVRLFTVDAIRREGECLRNCLAYEAVYLDGFSDIENPLRCGLWSLRRRTDGVSIALAETYFGEVLQFAGPHNEIPAPSRWPALRQLIAFFEARGAMLDVGPIDALIDSEGAVHRADKAPTHLHLEWKAGKDAEAERQRRFDADWAAAQREVDIVRGVDVGTGIVSMTGVAFFNTMVGNPTTTPS